MTEPDLLKRFIFEGCAVRGEWVHLDRTWIELSANAPYPPRVRQALGDATAAVALLAATLRFNGSLTLQISGDAYIKMLVVQATGERQLRGMAHWDETLADDNTERLFAPDARLVMTLAPGAGKERYQGMVSLQGDSIAEAIAEYFLRSEQLPTRLWLAGDEHCVAGLLLQKLPESDQHDADAWDRVVALASTVNADELLQLDSSTLLHRLYHEEQVRVFEPEQIRFQCRCSREKIETVIRSMGRDECREILADEGTITAQCEFCRATYDFDAVDVEAVFAATHDVSERFQ